MLKNYISFQLRVPGIVHIATLKWLFDTDGAGSRNAQEGVRQVQQRTPMPTRRDGQVFRTKFM